MSTTVTWDGETADWYTDNWDYPNSTTNPGPPPPAGTAVTLSRGGTVTVDSSEPGYRPLDVASVDVDNTTLVVDEDQTIPDLTLAGIDGGGIITTGSGVGPVTITVSGNFAMGAKYLNGVVSDGHIDGNITISLTGTGNIGGTLGNDVIGGNDGGSAAIHVATVGKLTFDDGAALGADANGALINDGLVEKLAATTGTSGASAIGAQVTNASTGIIEVDAGSLVLSGSDNSIGGTIEGLGTLDLSGTSTLESDLTLADGATLESSGDTTLGSITAAVPAGATFEIDGGTVTGTSATTTWTINGALDLVQGLLTDTSPTFRSTPDLYVSSTGTLSIGGDLYEGENYDPDPFVLGGTAFIQNGGTATLGTSTVPGALEFSDDSSDLAIFQNLAGGTFTITNSTITSSFINSPVAGYNYGYFYNDGTLISVSDANNPDPQNYIQVASIVQDGTIDVQQGGLFIDSYFTNLDGGAFTGAGTLTLDPYTTATIDDGITSSVGTLQLDAGDGGGALYQIAEDFTQTGALIINGPTLQIDNEILLGGGTMAYQSYTVTVDGLTTLDGGVLEAGTLLTEGGFSAGYAGSGIPSLTVEGATLENAGSSTIAGSSIVLAAGTGTYNPGQPGELLNDTGGTITLSDTDNGFVMNGSITGLGDGSMIENLGTIIGLGETSVDPTQIAYAPDLNIAADSVVNDGTIAAQQGQLDLGGPLSGTGTLQVYHGAVLATDGTVNGNAVQFVGTGGWLQINDLASQSSDSPPVQQQDFNGTISGFTTGDTIGISTTGLGMYGTIDATGTPVFSAATDTTSLALTDAGATVATLTFTGNDSADIFTLTPDTSSNQVEELTVACYCRGTMIATDCGDVAVEALAIGDRVLTKSGPPRPIKWIGQRSYRGWLAAGNARVWPIRFKAGSLADQVPRRDLLVSPEHAMFLGGSLIPAGCLVNGVSIVKEGERDTVEYFHVELDRHDVILAEGAWSESFVDDDSRTMFHNLLDYYRLYPDSIRAPAVYCAPRIDEGYELEAIRQQLAARARQMLPAPRSSLRGGIYHAGLTTIEGWAQDQADPAVPVTVIVCNHGVEVARVVADAYRADLEHAGVGDGRFAFTLLLPEALSPWSHHVVTLLDARDGRELPGSPILLGLPDPLAEAAPQLGALQGQLDIVSRTLLTGWALDVSQPERPVGLIVMAGGTVIARVLANRYRADLEAAGLGTGRLAFELVMPDGLSVLEDQHIRVLREADGAELSGSPAVLPAARGFDPDVAGSLATLLANLDDDGEADRALGFLVEQADRLLLARAERHGGRAAQQAHRLFRRRWGVADQPHDPASDEPARRVLVIDDVTPDPRRDAGSVAIVSHMRALRDLGYQVSFVPAMGINDKAALLRLEATEDLEACGAPYYTSVEDVLTRQRGSFDMVYLHRLANAERYLALVRTHHPQARVIYSVADLHHVRFARQAQVERRPELVARSRQMALGELLAAGRADLVVTHSPAEATLLRREIRAGKVHVIPWALTPRPCGVPFARRHGVTFVGGFAHAPNPDAVFWLSRDIMPLVWAQDPAITCKIIGYGWQRDQLPCLDSRIEVVGPVDDLAAGLAETRLTVAPLRFGAGIKGKVLDSLACAVPCAMTEVAAEGIPLPPALQGLVGPDAAAIADIIVGLHRDAALNRRMADAGLAMVAESFSAESVAEAFAAMLRTGADWGAKAEAMAS
jgi:glycosyltransferase involved in cell wall biosynthesis